MSFVQVRAADLLFRRSPNFDLNMMEAFRLQIMNLREARGIRKCNHNHYVEMRALDTNK